MRDPDSDKGRPEVEVDRLTAKMGKYALVVGVAKRARELRERMRGQPDAAPATAITRALEEIADHKVRVRSPDEEHEEEAAEEAEQESA